MAFKTTPQTVNQVVKAIETHYQVPPGIARKALRETGYQPPTSNGYSKYNHAQMMTIWSDLAEWMKEWKR